MQLFSLKDYYKILSIESNANAEEIKKAYRKLALKYHPDINKSSMANDNFMQINEAYRVLIDDQKRKLYDINLKYGLETRELIIKHDKYREGDGKKYGTAYKYPKQPPRTSRQSGRYDKENKTANTIMFYILLIIGGSAIYASVRDLFSGNEIGRAHVWTPVT